MLIGCFASVCLGGSLEFEVSFQWPKRFLGPPMKAWANIKNDKNHMKIH